MTSDSRDGGESPERRADVDRGSDDTSPGSPADGRGRPAPVAPHPRHRFGPVSFIEAREGGDVEWAVFEVDAGAGAGAHGTRCLIFWRDDCFRRVREYPADWRLLDDAGLTALSRHR